MKLKKIVLFVVVLVFGVVGYYFTRSNNRFFLQIKEAGEKATSVDLYRRSLRYRVFYKKMNSSFKSRLIESICFEKVVKINGQRFCGYHPESIYIEFYEGNSNILRMVFLDGKIETDKWDGYLTSKSQANIRKLFLKMGLSEKPRILPLARNITAATNVVFRKTPSIPYTIDGAVFVLPGERFNIGFVEEEINLTYCANQRCDPSFNIHFYTEKNDAGENQKFVEIKNNALFNIQFSLFYVIDDALIIDNIKDPKLDPRKSTKIKLPKKISCLILTDLTVQKWEKSIE